MLREEDQVRGTNKIDSYKGKRSSGECRVTGNRKCNHLTWGESGGYQDGCCTPEQPCAEKEGDCSLDSDCLPGLVCGKDNCPKDVGFDSRAACCELVSGKFNPSEY